MQTLDKKTLYGTFLKSMEDKRKLNQMAIAKALDLPLGEDVQVDNSRHYAGLGTMASAVLAFSLLLGGASAGALAYSFLAPANRSPAEANPIEGRIKFWVEDDGSTVIEQETETSPAPAGDPNRFTTPDLKDGKPPPPGENAPLFEG
ncbi:MAG: hypothetical protein GTO41_19945 [Burkholderiales bacterium]|nr:hypothetical protein [Burkholderiales bacterium]